jgi:hypothetical protein
MDIITTGVPPIHLEFRPTSRITHGIITGDVYYDCLDCLGCGFELQLDFTSIDCVACSGTGRTKETATITLPSGVTDVSIYNH